MSSRDTSTDYDLAKEINCSQDWNSGFEAFLQFNRNPSRRDVSPWNQLPITHKDLWSSNCFRNTAYSSRVVVTRKRLGQARYRLTFKVPSISHLIQVVITVPWLVDIAEPPSGLAFCGQHAGPIMVVVAVCLSCVNALCPGYIELTGIWLAFGVAVVVDLHLLGCGSRGD